MCHLSEADWPDSAEFPFALASYSFFKRQYTIFLPDEWIVLKTKVERVCFLKSCRFSAPFGRLTKTNLSRRRVSVAYE